MLEHLLSAKGYYDAYYSKGQRVRRLLQNKINEVLKEFQDFAYFADNWNGL